MKIIFDSEEQKEKFIAWISSFFCPADIGIGEKDCKDHDGCEDCWEHCGIEMTVAKNRKYLLIYGNNYVTNEEITTKTVFDGPDTISVAMDFLETKEKDFRLVEGWELPDDWWTSIFYDVKEVKENE